MEITLLSQVHFHSQLRGMVKLVSWSVGQGITHRRFAKPANAFVRYNVVSLTCWVYLETRKSSFDTSQLSREGDPCQQQETHAVRIAVCTPGRRFSSHPEMAPIFTDLKGWRFVGPHGCRWRDAEQSLTGFDDDDPQLRPCTNVCPGTRT